jgi:CO/xanthine dehydrogenase FAD-binding subunit
LPTIKDVPNIDAILVENPDKYGPYGAKSLGEPTLELGAAAINNSVKFAMNTKYRANPLTLERVFLGKDLVKKVRQSEVISKERCKLPTDAPQLGVIINDNAPEKTSERVSDISITTAKTLTEALEIMSAKKHWMISGGTDVIIQLRKEKYHKDLLDISQIKELKGVDILDNNIVIGGASTFSSLINNELIQKHLPLFVDGISLIGSTQIRSRATIGGNLSNAAPCADSVPSLFVYDASVKVQSSKESRVVKISDFIQGSYKTTLKEDEIITQVIIPIPKNKKYYKYFFKLGRRNALNITRMSVASLISFDTNNKIDEAYIMPGSVFGRPQRLTNIEEFLVGKELTSELVEEVIVLIDEKLESEIGGRWSSPYKVPVFKNMLRDALLTIKEEK